MQIYMRFLSEIRSALIILLHLMNLSVWRMPQIILLRIIQFSVPYSCDPGSSATVVSGYGLENRGSIPDEGGGFFL
jgi:hypothetical protein